MSKAREVREKIRILRMKDFDSSLYSMWQTGGQKKKKADKVLAVLGKLSLGIAAFKDLQATDHGERRIKSCVKYELGDGCRLITIQSEKTIALCFVGDHEDCNRWLDSHSGLVLASVEGTLQPAYASPSADKPLVREPIPSQRPLVESLPEHLVDELFSDVPPKVILKVSNLSGIPAMHAASARLCARWDLSRSSRDGLCRVATLIP